MYLQIQIYRCTPILTINIHRGLFKSKWPSFAMKSTPFIIQIVLSPLRVECHVEIIYFDDILIQSESHEHRFIDVKCVFEKIRKYGFELSEETTSSL